MGESLLDGQAALAVVVTTFRSCRQHEPYAQPTAPAKHHGGAEGAACAFAARLSIRPVFFCQHLVQVSFSPIHRFPTFVRTTPLHHQHQHTATAAPLH
jgi:hypothetical protein